MPATTLTIHPDHPLPPGSTLISSSGSRLGCFAPSRLTFEWAGSIFSWHTRYQRKGRYPVVKSSHHHIARHPVVRFMPIWFGWPFADISYWVAFVFTLGCLAWVVNSHYAFVVVRVPSAAAGDLSEERAAAVAAVAALIGGTLFEVGSWLLYWEALNPEPAIETGHVLEKQEPTYPAPFYLKITIKRPVPAQEPAMSAGTAGTAAGAGAGAGAAAAMKIAVVPGPLPAELSSQLPAPAPNAAGMSSSDVSASETVSSQWLCPGENQRPRVLLLQQQQLRLKQLRLLQGLQPVTLQTLLHNPAAATAALKPVTAAGGGAAPSPAAAPTDLEAQCVDTLPTADVRPAAGAVQQRAAGRQHAAFSGSSAAGAKPVGSQVGPAASSSGSSASSAATALAAGEAPRWRWFGLRFHDIGFTASFLQLVGATVFWIPCIFATPGVYTAESSSNAVDWDAAYWLTQVIGASFFMASSLLFMLEVQPAWWRPQPQLAGWHIGFWNLVGAIGFWLSGLFGFWAVPSGRYQQGGTVASTFWGSYAFLIGSYLQLLKAINKHPESLSVKRALGQYRPAKTAAVTQRLVVKSSH